MSLPNESVPDRSASQYARLTVVDGALTEYPIAQRTRGGWQNGVTFYPDEKVTDVTYLKIQPVQDAQDPSESLALCGVTCSHGDLCTLSRNHEGDHKALYAYAEPDGGFYCSWPQEATS